MRMPPPARRTLSVGGRWVPSRPIGDPAAWRHRDCRSVHARGPVRRDLDEAIANFADQLGVPFSESLAADNDSF
jgi:hypothetical protein